MVRASPTATPGAPGLFRDDADRSLGERQFLRLWKSLGGPLDGRLREEFAFHPTRRWRFDFAWIDGDLKVGIEVHGGVWKRGGHTTGRGVSRDCEKGFEAVMHGWRVISLTTAQVTRERVRRVIEFCLGRGTAAAEMRLAA